MFIKGYNDFIKENSDEKLAELQALTSDNEHLWWLDKDKLKQSSEELAEILKSECAPFINEMSEYKEFMYRGTHKSTINYDKRKTRKNRRARNSDQFVSNFMDTQFLKKFGTKLRSETVFATVREADASAYGETYLFFPIGDYKYYWNGEISDLFGEVDNIKWSMTEDEIYGENTEKFDNKLIEIADNYREGNIKGAIRTQIEVMYDCDEYYMVKTAYEPMLRKLLFGEN